MDLKLRPLNIYQQKNVLFSFDLWDAMILGNPIITNSNLKEWLHHASFKNTLPCDILIMERHLQVTTVISLQYKQATIIFTRIIALAHAYCSTARFRNHKYSSQ